MKRIKLVFAVGAAVAVMMIAAAPAMAHPRGGFAVGDVPSHVIGDVDEDEVILAGGHRFFGYPGVCNDLDVEDGFLVCDLD